MHGTRTTATGNVAASGPKPVDGPLWGACDYTPKPPAIQDAALHQGSAPRRRRAL